MAQRTHQLFERRSETALSLLLGTGAAVALFIVMALAQMMGQVSQPRGEIEEVVMAYVPPEIEELDEEPPPPEEEEEEAIPELAEEPPQLSLDQLDIALNPGTGGSLAGDFALPTAAIGSSASDLGTEDFVDFSQLDQVPRPVGVSGFNFPRRLRKEKVNGRIVLLIRLDSDGDVLDVQLESSSLPKFNDFVVAEVTDWKFTPPTKQGHPVKAQARLPIPIRIN